MVTNTGTAPADEIALSGQRAERLEDRRSSPRPSTSIEPGKDAEVQALMTPTDKSLAGDYQATLRAASRGETASSQFRVAVATSTVWGMAGAGIIAIALLIMVGAVARFGRR